MKIYSAFPIGGLTAWCLLSITASQAGVLDVRIVDSEGHLMPVRAWVDAQSKRYFQPLAPESASPYARDRSFSCDGWFQIEIPAGRATVHIERGKEWRPVFFPVTIADGATRMISINMRRWVNMPAEGYYSADMHLHFGHDRLAVLKQLALADDVHVLPAFSYWLRGTEEGWNSQWPAWPGGGTLRVDDTHFVTRANLEIERISRNDPPGASVGASFIFNLEHPLTAERFDTRFPTDASLCLKAKEAAPNCVIDTDKPSWAETVIGAALGAYDTAQLCHNHYHRLQTLPGGWGMIGPLDENESPLDQADELFHRTNRHYYGWLNCGIRMSVSGGSASGSWPSRRDLIASTPKCRGL